MEEVMPPEDESEFFKQWASFLYANPALFRPSFSQAIQGFAQNRNPSTHGGHPITKEEECTILRSQAWVILCYMGQSCFNNPYVQNRQDQHRKSFFNHLSDEYKDRICAWEKQLPEKLEYNINRDILKTFSLPFE